MGKLTPVEKFCERMERRLATPFRVKWTRRNDLKAMLRVVRAAGTVIDTDADYGVELEPEVAEAMDSLAIALGDLPRETDDG